MTGALRRAALAALVAVGLLLGAGDTLVRATLPALRALVPWWAPEFKVLALDVGRAGADRSLRIEVTLAHSVVLGGRVVVPDERGRAEAATPALQGLLAPLVALWAAASWGQLPWRRRGLALLLVLPGAVLLAVVLPALALAASLWAVMVQALAPQDFSFLLALQRAAAAGGGLALALVLGLAAAGLARAGMVRWRHGAVNTAS